MRSGRTAVWLVAVAAAVPAGGCGDARAPARSAAPALLDPGALSGMRAATRTLDRAQLALQTPIPGLADRLRAWGFTGAGEREFTAARRSPLERVVARTVAFRDPAGAAAYARTLTRRAAAYLGEGARTSTLRGAGGRLIHPPACGCRPGPPTLIAVLPSARETFWLALTGDGATASAARRLARDLPG